MALVIERQQRSVIREHRNELSFSTRQTKPSSGNGGRNKEDKHEKNMQMGALVEREKQRGGGGYTAFSQAGREKGEGVVMEG